MYHVVQPSSLSPEVDLSLGSVVGVQIFKREATSLDRSMPRTVQLRRPSWQSCAQVLLETKSSWKYGRPVFHLCISTLVHSIIEYFVRSFSNSFIHSFVRSFTYSLTHSLTHTLTYPPPPPLTRSLSHPITHSHNQTH